MTDVEHVIEYRAIRPDGTLLYQTYANSCYGILRPCDGLGELWHGQEWIAPPWLVQYRDPAGVGEWTTQAEKVDTITRTMVHPTEGAPDG